MKRSSTRYLSAGLTASMAFMSACQAQQQPVANSTKPSTPNASPNMMTHPTSSPVSKQEVMDFLRKFKTAVETDAFADPKKLQEVIGLETSQWLVDGTNDKVTGAYSRPQVWKFQDDWLNRESKGSSVHSNGYTIRHYDKFIRYSASILNIDKASSLSVGDVRSIFGMSLVKQVPWIGTNPLGGGSAKGGWRVTLEYEFPTDVDKKVLRFEFNHDPAGNPLDLKEVSISKSMDFFERERRKDVERRMNTK